MSMRRTQQGLTIVEIMIGLTLGILVTGGIIQIYVSSKISFKINENLTRMQEEGFYALEMLTRDIRLAGFRSVSDPRNVPAPLSNALTGANSIGPNGSDSISISYANNVDCVGTNVAGITTNTYLLATGQNGRGALFCNGTELIANLDDLQITFGEDADGDMTPEHYVSADLIANMANVVSVRVALLIRSEEPINSNQDNKTYLLAGSGSGPYNDKHIRRLFASTAQMRNCLRNSC